mmetsp:Transcript_6667/g.13879  ORF Transcript_6667/g.13879 Transcript_6667/m.13879 type:complete len:348 (+) Transcript_6667:37-1080(+)
MRASLIFPAAVSRGKTLARLIVSFTAVVGAIQTNARPSVHYPSYLSELPSMAGKTVAVTGASRGLGYVTAISLAKKGARVILLNRSPGSGSALTEIAASATGPAPLEIGCDLQNFADVRAAAAALASALGGGGLDALCLNAGVMKHPDVATVDGYDVTAQTNVLSHFLLAGLLLPELRAAAAARGGARIVSMSSFSGFGGRGLDARFLERRGGALGGSDAAYERYHQSKLANLLFTAGLKDRLQADDDDGGGVMALGCHPGVCGTDMFKQVSGSEDLSQVPSVEDGVLSQLKCICDPGVRSGQCFGPDRASGLPEEFENSSPTINISTDAKETLWAACERAVGPFFR